MKLLGLMLAGMSVLATACAGAPAADLSSPPALSSASAVQHAEAITRAKCLRDHGIPVADPSFGPEVATIIYPYGVGPGTPGFSEAQAACAGS